MAQTRQHEPRPQPDPPRAVPSATQLTELTGRISGVIETLDRQIHTLTEELAPVLMVEENIQASDYHQDPPATPLNGTLMGLENALLTVNHRLARLRSRVSL